MRTTLPSAPAESMSIHPWPDQVIDAVGHHPCSTYVETYWLGILGPSTTFLLRHLVTALEASPEGFELSLAETARRLGLGERPGRHGPFVRSLQRVVRFGLAQPVDATTLAVRRRVPPLTQRQVARLPAGLQAAHERWQEAQLRLPPVEQLRQRTRQLALSYLEAGLDPAETERQLQRLDYHPALCHEATTWACRHRVRPTIGMAGRDP